MATPHFDAQHPFQALNARIDQMESRFESILKRIATLLEHVATPLACLANKITDMQVIIRSTH